MGLFKKKDKREKLIMTHYEGIPGFKTNCACNMILDAVNQTLQFEMFATKDSNIVTLPLNKIITAKLVTASEITEQSKLGRAAIGGLLFGGAGAIVGALSAGEKEKLKMLYIINYLAEGEEKVIVMKENGNINYFKFQKQLDSLLPNDEVQCGNIIL